VDDSNVLYAPPAIRSSMLAQGKICFKTCFHQARILISHIATLAQATYSHETELHTLQDAIHHWLLVEIIGAIGGHTVA